MLFHFSEKKYSRREVINMCIKLFPLWIVCPCAYPYVLQSRAVSRLCVCHGCDIGYWTFVWDIWRLWCPESNLYLLEHSDTYSASSTQWLLELDNAGWREKKLVIGRTHATWASKSRAGCQWYQRMPGIGGTWPCKSVYSWVNRVSQLTFTKPWWGWWNITIYSDLKVSIIITAESYVTVCTAFSLLYHFLPHSSACLSYPNLHHDWQSRNPCNYLLLHATGLSASTLNNTRFHGFIPLPSFSSPLPKSCDALSIAGLVA